MKNLKTISILVLTLVSTILFMSCENENLEINEEKYAKIDITKLAQNFSKDFKSKESILSAFKREKANKFLNKSEKEKPFIININTRDKEVKYTKEDLPNFYSNKQKVFLLKYFNRIANVTNGELLTEITYYKSLLIDESFSESEYNQIFPILDVNEQTVLAINKILKRKEKLEKSSSQVPDGWWEYLKCLANGGSTIARGLVEGAITGLVGGAILGASGGTAVLPGIGTATGTVGGAIFGMAGGSVVGAFGGALWVAIDCAHHLKSKSSSENIFISYRQVGSLGYSVYIK